MILLCRAKKGRTLQESAADALALAKRLQVDVEFEREGLKVRIKPSDTPQRAAERANAAAAIRRPEPGDDLIKKQALTGLQPSEPRRPA